jgi:hypothetical protein
VALEKMHEQLLLIEKSMSVTQNIAKSPLSYDAVKTTSPAAHAPTEKFVPGRLLNEVTVK